MENPMLVNGQRHLVTIRKITAINDIAGADRIKVATIDGWEVVVKAGEFNVGDYCVFFEIDSLLPVCEPFMFLADKAKVYGEDPNPRIRLRTMKMKGQISQGLALPTSILDPYWNANCDTLDAWFNVSKYEPPICLDGVSARNPAGTFPIFIPKTDEERCQNIFSEYKEKYQNVKFVKSLKLDGSSITMAWLTDPIHFSSSVKDLETGIYAHDYDDAQFIVASRNQTLRYDPNNMFWRGVENTQVIERMKVLGKAVAIQGELMGPKIQGNREGFVDYKIFAFRAWWIDEQRMATHEEFCDLCATLGLTMIPQLDTCLPFQQYDTVKDMLADADIPSINNKIAEGVVYKSMDLVNGQSIHFKAINNKFLLKGGD